ncbi:uncharacterized protein si:dkey-19b23.7 [Thalassophryne amazonica]|uniref:uncharacterized protein si:dkey-19b23.7 n=1 Tax=Thalassophryne amazonica TaxID=390379 RepID=UPI0014721454|nr:uncharacterized protein si:dkey-19b23.7 [Thalassophryne amazonica]
MSSVSVSLTSFTGGCSKISTVSLQLLNWDLCWTETQLDAAEELLGYGAGIWFSHENILCAQKRERDQRRKLQHFLSDLALLGSLQGFKYFQPWLRGKEELLLTVINDDPGWRSPGFLVSRASSHSSCSSSNSSDVSSSSSSSTLDSRTSSPLPEKPSDPPQTTRVPSSEEHLLPASPSEREMAVPEVNCTLFLLAGYVKYGRPHAWIRSNHDRLVTIGGTDSMVRDTPMKLKSIADWQTRGTRIWDIVSELVCLCTIPCPSNPFALDMHYIQSLAVPESFLVTGALLNFLEAYVVYGHRDELHYDKVVDEVKPLRRLHVQSLLQLQRLKAGSGSTSSPAVQYVSGEE